MLLLFFCSSFSLSNFNWKTFVQLEWCEYQHYKHKSSSFSLSSFSFSSLQFHLRAKMNSWTEDEMLYRNNKKSNGHLSSLLSLLRCLKWSFDYYWNTRIYSVYVCAHSLTHTHTYILQSTNRHTHRNEMKTMRMYLWSYWNCFYVAERINKAVISDYYYYFNFFFFFLCIYFVPFYNGNFELDIVFCKLKMKWKEFHFVLYV